VTFKKAIWLSFILHVVLGIFSVTRAFLSPSEPLQLQDAIRVDIVGLPQKIVPDEPLPPEPAAAAPTKPEPVAAPTPPPPPPPKPEGPKFVEKPKPEKPAPDHKKSQANALNRLREMDAFAKLEKAAAERKAAEARAKAEADAKARAAQPIAGHQITSGNSLTGISRLDYDRYGAELKAHVLSNWAVPAWLAEADLSARVRVWLDDGGHVTKKQITRSSGNDVFDAAALDAVTKSDPFPRPPVNLRGVLAAEGFTLGLPK